VRPLVAVSTIQRDVQTTLPGPPLPEATVHRRLGELVAKAGGAPVYVEPFTDVDTVIQRAAAVIVNGGGDVDPNTYGAERHPKLDWVDPERDEFELELARRAHAANLPLFGICRGLHVLNVAVGGTLIQHLPDVTGFEHSDREQYSRPVHSVRVETGSRLSGIVGVEEFDVNTVHHQAVDRLGSGLRISARAPDGIIEAIESADGRAFAVQWHPELLAPDYEKHQVPLFQALVAMTDRVPAR